MEPRPFDSSQSSAAAARLVVDLIMNASIQGAFAEKRYNLQNGVYPKSESGADKEMKPGEEESAAEVSTSEDGAYEKVSRENLRSGLNKAKKEKERAEEESVAEEGSYAQRLTAYMERTAKDSVVAASVSVATGSTAGEPSGEKSAAEESTAPASTYVSSGSGPA